MIQHRADMEQGQAMQSRVEVPILGRRSLYPVVRLQGTGTHRLTQTKGEIVRGNGEGVVGMNKQVGICV